MAFDLATERHDTVQESAAAPTHPMMAVAVTAALAAATVLLVAFVVWQDREGPAPWTSPRDMADAIGCTDTYQPIEASSSSSPVTAGTCQVLGSEVVLATSTSNETLRMWTDGVQWVKPMKGVSTGGDRFVVFSFTHDVNLMQVFNRLTQSSPAGP